MNFGKLFLTQLIGAALRGSAEASQVKHQPRGYTITIKELTRVKILGRKWRLNVQLEADDDPPAERPAPDPGE